jgi:hypothetical protein
LQDKPTEPLNLADAIARRFASFGEFEIPTIAREPLRKPPDLQGV